MGAGVGHLARPGRGALAAGAVRTRVERARYPDAAAHVADGPAVDDFEAVLVDAAGERIPLSVALTLQAGPGRVTFANDALLALTGWSREEAVGSVWFTRFVPGAETGRRLFDAMLAGGEGEALAVRLRELLARANAADAAAGRPYTLRFSIGVAVVETGEDLDAVLTRADAALYARKLARRAGVGLGRDLAGA